MSCLLSTLGDNHLDNKKNKPQQGINQLYQNDPVKAVLAVFGRFMPGGLIPAAYAGTTDDFTIAGKHPGLTILNDRPVNAEVPPHLLNDLITPADRLFVRNNGIPPQQVDVANWTLTIDGESVKTSKTYTITELKCKFKHHTYQLTLECGGNGRSEFNPPAKGNQWSTGAVGCAQWTGVRGPVTRCAKRLWH